MIYVLGKMSSPGWTFVTYHEKVMLNMMEKEVCSICKKTKPELLKDTDISTYYGEDMVDLDYELRSAFSEDYASMSYEDKMSELLYTHCGCEYYYEKFESRSDYIASLVTDDEVSTLGVDNNKG